MDAGYEHHRWTLGKRAYRILILNPPSNTKQNLTLPLLPSNVPLHATPILLKFTNGLIALMQQKPQQAVAYADLYVANDQDPNFLFQNNGEGHFLEVALISGVCYNDMGKEEAGMGTDFGDYNNDGWLDLTVSNYQTETNTVYHNHDGTFFIDNTITSGIAEVTHGYLGWGIRFFDYDNDGYQDIFVANGHLMDNLTVLEKHVTYPQRNLLFRNLGDGTFANVMSETDGLALKKVSRGAAIGDYDNDGDLDILVTNCNQRPDLLQNTVGNRNNWIQIQAVREKIVPIR